MRRRMVSRAPADVKVVKLDADTLKTWFVYGVVRRSDGVQMAETSEDSAGWGWRCSVCAEKRVGWGSPETRGEAVWAVREHWRVSHHQEVE